VRILAAVIVIWLITSAIATAQRGYFSSSDPTVPVPGRSP
jgi:hypothetical protein